MLLALLQAIAPSWHVCPGGSCAMPMSDGMAVPGGVFSTAALMVAAPECPNCLFSALHVQQKSNARRPTLCAQSLGHNVTCLACLLQSMQGQTGVTLALLLTLFLSSASYSHFPQNSVALALLRHYRGRAPPVTS